MRNQAMETTQQLQAANRQLIATNEQLDLMRKQAEETDKQSKTLMVFTVVTIVFVRPRPLSRKALRGSYMLEVYLS